MQGTQYEGTIWISFGETDGHTLYPVDVCGPAADAAPGTAVCRVSQDAEAMEPFTDPGSSYLDERDAVVYFNGPGGFLQQPARIYTSSDDHEARTIRVEPIGIAAIAEDRIVERVTLGIPECTAVVNEDDVCQIVDASTRGLSIVSSAFYPQGTIVDVAFEVGSGVYSGQCRIRSIVRVRDQTRYGMTVVPAGPACTLRAGLGDLTAAAQRAERRPIVSRAG